MHQDAVRAKAFAMPLTSPAYSVGPYRFRHREYLIITYRTDPHKLRARPGTAPGARASREIRVHSHAGLDVPT